MHDLDRTQNGISPDSYRSPALRAGSVLSEDEQMNLAADLMELSNEEEFEQFLGDLVRKAGSAFGNFIKSPAGQAIGGALKDVAKQALTAGGQAIGQHFGPQGSQIAGALTSAITSQFEAGDEEQEWEAANNFVKLGAEAVKNAATAAPGDPHAVAKNAVIEAAKVHAPHLVPALSNGAMHEPQGKDVKGRSGRWIRHHNRIILLGV